MNSKLDAIYLCIGLLSFGYNGIVCSASKSRRLVLDEQSELTDIVNNLQTRVEDLESELTSVKTAQTVIGSTYVRWGRTSCPGNGTEFVYKGYMAGGQWDQSGSGANHLCLPDDPVWDKYVDGYNSGATIQGTEIEEDGNVAASIFGKDVYNQDMPCAVCRSLRSSQAMFPARAMCYPGWTYEYGGYIASSRPTWAANSDYVCLDKHLEFLPHGAGNDEQHAIKIVEAHCGSLACPPYHEGRELACVVCTK